MKVVLRMVGHEFLLQMGDSISRILPIQKVDDRYSIQFENDFAIEPDLLSFFAFKIFEKNNIKNGYIMEVESCETNEVVYSFEEDHSTTNDLIPCKSRPLPKGCYKFYFTFLGKVETEIPEKKDTNQSGVTIIYVLILASIIVGTVIYFRKKKITSTLNPNWIVIGQFYFDKKGMKLILNGEEEELSSKEADLLELLCINENETLEREHILNVVWKDEGDYIGRTLDVSISKLRKKLKQDPNIKIVNIRGVGYRFVVSN